MKVLHLISGGDTGGARMHVHLLLSMLSRDMDVTLCCFMKGPFSDDAMEMGIDTVVLDGMGPLRALRRLKKMLRERHFDIIHCHGSRGNLMGTLLKPHTDIPLVTTVHSDYRLDYLDRPAARRVYGTLNSISLRFMDYHIGVSESMRRTLISRGFDPNKTFSIFNGVDFSREPKKTDQRVFFQKLGFEVPRDSIVVGIAARLNPVKDISTLIRAFALAHSENASMRLIIAGSGSEEESLRQLSTDLGIENAVCFCGWVSDMDEFYGALDINTLCSLSETFPYALTEGARFALATISSRVGGVGTLISHGENGLLFEPGDAETLGEHLLSLANNPALREKLGLSLFEKTKRDFSAESTCQHQKDIYVEILRRKAAGRFARDGIVICGAYGHGNTGDDAILEAIVTQLRLLDPFIKITVMARRTAEIPERYGIAAAHTFNVLKFLPLMSRSKVYINGGGSLIQDVTSRRSLWYYLFTIRQAKKRGCRVIMYGCGIGPVVHPSDVIMVRRDISNNVDIVTLREAHSMDELKRFGVEGPDIILSSDPALTLPPADNSEVGGVLKKHGIDPNGRYICFVLRRWKGALPSPLSFVEAAKRAYCEHGLTPVFLSLNYLNDDAAAMDVIKNLDLPYKTIFEPLCPALTIGLLSKMTVVLSMRLHGLIFAAGQGVSLIGVAYDPKVTAFMSCIGHRLHISIDELCPERLTAMVDEAVRLANNQDELKALAKRMIELESRNIESVRRLLSE